MENLTPMNAAWSRDNLLLRALPTHEFAQLRSRLEAVWLDAGAVLCEPGRRLEHLYFPLSSVVSLLQSTESGQSAQATLVGHEGVVGVALLLGGVRGNETAVALRAGWAWRLPRRAMREPAQLVARMQHGLLQFHQMLHFETARTMLCSRYHRIDQQFCRWLLLAADRGGSDTMALTHEVVAHTMGVRRETITGVLLRLRRLGAISCGRGRITIADRELLEHAGCECHAVIAAEYERHFGVPPGRALPRVAQAGR